jgi:structure-specific endonuclease subunit SLX1
MSMHDKLANLHILLRAKSFERWPLQVKFFAEDVYKMWHRWTVNMPEVIRQGIEIEMDESILQKASLEEDPSNLIGIHKIDPTYQHMKTTLEKSRKLLLAPNNSCIICRSALESAKEMSLVCSNQECNSIFHIECLSTHFLKGEYGAQDAIVPTCGHCPSCKVSLNWTDLVKDLSLRIRGEKEVTALFKEPKRRKKNVKESAKSTAIVDHEEAEEPDVLADESDPEIDFDDVLLQSDYEDVDQIQATPSGGDDWKLVDELDEQATPVIAASARSSAVKTRKAFIEDSDWDEAEVIE